MNAPHVHVSGGTGAGRRPPFNGRAAEWECRCVVAHELLGGDGAVGYTRSHPVFKTNIGALRACPDCGCRRPG